MAVTTVSLQQALNDFEVNYVNVSKDDRKKSVKVVCDRVVDELVSRMKEADDLFELLYGGIYYTGSSYEGLKVGEADEFDLNVILKLPSELTRGCKKSPSSRYYQIRRRGIPPGFVVFKVNKKLRDSDNGDMLDEFFEDAEDGHFLCLCRENLVNWFQSVVDQALNHCQQEEQCFPKVTRRCSGPAITLTFHRKNLAVDLVPVIQLDSCPWSVTSRRRSRKSVQKLQVSKYRQKPKQKRMSLKPTPKKKQKKKEGVTASVPPENSTRCFLVPKQAPDHLIIDGPEWWSLCQDVFFRVSMPDEEKEMLMDKGCAKNLVRIFKAIKEKENWSFLPSYYIKTVFLWKISEDPKGDWPKSNMDELFKMMLKEFLDVLERRHLPHIFFPSLNLLDSIPDTSLTNVLARLNVFLEAATENTLDPWFISYLNA